MVDQPKFYRETTLLVAAILATAAGGDQKRERELAESYCRTVDLIYATLRDNRRERYAS
jgi:hypothetical protein